LPFWGSDPEFRAPELPGLFTASASNDLADLLHIPTHAGNGIAACNGQSEECENDYFFHLL